MPSPRTFHSHAASDTQSLGESWAREVQPGWVIGLSGDLGTGKTQLVQGLARGLGFAGKVQSPTFALINEYPGHLTMFHLDLYRLDTKKQIIAAGLEEYFHRPRGIAVIEWIERWTGSVLAANDISARFRAVTFEQVSETERRITYEDFGV